MACKHNHQRINCFCSYKIMVWTPIPEPFMSQKLSGPRLASFENRTVRSRAFRIYGNYTVFSKKPYIRFIRLRSCWRACTSSTALRSNTCGTSSHQLSLSRNRFFDHSGSKIVAFRALHPKTRLTCSLGNKISFYKRFNTEAFGLFLYGRFKNRP